MLFKMLPGIAMPIGMSFYSFQMISYLADIYKGSVKAEKSPVNLALYFCWYPKFMSGPIEKAKGFLTQCRALWRVKLFENDRLFNGMLFVVYGLFSKFVIADRLAVYVENFFEGYQSFSAPMLMLGSLFYTIQIYLDFSGYTYMAIGISKLFGIELSANFNIPYAAENISDFWRRWHMTLSTFLKEYIYIPLGGNRKGIKVKYVNLMIVFLICGLWHGKGFSFIAWGLLHGFYSVITDILKRKNINWAISGNGGRIITFCAVSLAWIFFRATSFTGACVYILRMFTAWADVKTIGKQWTNLGLKPIELIIILVGILVILIVEIRAYRQKAMPAEYLFEIGEIKRCVVIALLIVVIFIFGKYGSDLATQFIYMQF